MQKRFFTALLVIMLLLSLSACSSSDIVILSKTPEPKLTAVPTPTPTATPNPTPTVEPTPTPTPQKAEAKAGILKGEARAEAEVNQRFEDFLNGTGEFTDERIRAGSSLSCYNDSDVLGCLASYDDGALVDIQGVLLYYKIISQGEVFAFGTENRNKERIITLIEFPSQVFLDNGRILSVPLYNDSVLGDSIPLLYKFEQRNSSYYTFLNSYIGKPFCVTIYTYSLLEDPNSINRDDSYKKTHALMDVKVEINCSFLTGVNFIDNENGDMIKSNKRLSELIVSTSAQVLTIESFAEFEISIASCYDSIPNCNTISFIKCDND